MKKNEIKDLKGLAEIQTYLGRLYPNSNLSVDYIYGYVARTVGYLCKNIALKRAEQDHFIKPISWIVAISNKLNINIADAFSKRFPSCCPYCLVSRCICFRTKKSPVSYIPAYKVKDRLFWEYNSYKDSFGVLSLDECARNINNIYPNNEIVWHHAGPWYHFAKMQEEVCEIHEALSKFSAGKKPLEVVGEEIADTLAWIVGAWAIVKPEASLHGAIIDYYLNGCPVCGKAPCKCDPRSDRVAELVDVEKLESINEQLTVLKGLLPNSSDKIEELQKSITSATTTQSEPVAVQAVKQTRLSLDSIRDTLSTTDEIGEKAISIVSTIFNILSKIPI